MKKGLKRGVPSPSAKFITSFWKVSKPPIPAPQITPTLNLSRDSMSRFASLIASSDDTIAYCAKRSILLTSLRSKKSKGSKYLVSQANFVLNFSVSKYVIGADPLLPFFNPSQYSGIVVPIGVNAPQPVTTTRFNFTDRCVYFFASSM